MRDSPNSSHRPLRQTEIHQAVGPMRRHFREQTYWVIGLVSPNQDGPMFLAGEDQLSDDATVAIRFAAPDDAEEARDLWLTTAVAENVPPEFVEVYRIDATTLTSDARAF